MPKIDQLLTVVQKAKASDLHLAAGSVPMIRVNGVLEKTRHKVLSDDHIRQLLYDVLAPEQIRMLEQTGDLDFAYSIDSLARFRISAYQQQTGIAAAVRLIPDGIPDVDELGLSVKVTELVERKSGLLLVTGPTSSGKSSTLAALVDHINTHFCRHIVTLEDPIEYVHSSKNSLISQRQIGVHSDSYESAMRSALREDADVILIGEMRDTETISLAITAAEVGALVLGTLHTCNAASTIDRITDVFQPEQQQQVRVMLADTLVGVISQQLLARANGAGRILAYEQMVCTPAIKALIRESRSHQIPSVIQTGRKHGMRLLDSHLKALVDSGKIDIEQAIRVAINPTDFCQRVSSESSELVGA